MMRFLAGFLLCLVGSGTWAASLGSTATGLVAEVAARRAALPTGPLTRRQAKQKAALGRADLALAHDGGKLAGHLVDARKIVAALDAGYPGDATFGPLLASLVAGLTAEAEAVLDALVAGRDALAAGPDRTKATKKLDKASALLAAVGAAPTHTAAVRGLTKALAQLTAAQRLVGPPGPGGGPTTTEFDMDIGSPATDHVHLPAASPGVLDHYTTVANGSGPGIFTLSAGGDGTATTHALMFFVLGPGVGTRNMVVTGSSYTAIPGDALPLTSGTVSFTTWDPAHQKCQGTFTATFGGTVVSGTFSSTTMVVQ